MSRLAKVMALVVLFVSLGAGAAFAAGAVIQCKGTPPCVATGDKDVVYERIGDGLRDEIILKGGDDLVHANKYTRDTDVVRSSSGDDRIYVNDGDTKDTIYGGKGEDLCIVDAKSEAKGCGRVQVDR